MASRGSAGGFLRTGHGRGAGSPRIEVTAPDELAAATPPIAAARERDALGHWLPGNAASRRRKVRPGLRGAVATEHADPAYASFARWGSRYAGHRRAELAAAHGGVLSAGVGALVESAGAALADARYLRRLAATKGEPALFSQAARMAESARQHELAAWELAAREAKASPKAPPLAAVTAIVRELQESKG